MCHHRRSGVHQGMGSKNLYSLSPHLSSANRPTGGDTLSHLALQDAQILDFLGGGLPKFLAF